MLQRRIPVNVRIGYRQRRRRTLWELWRAIGPGLAKDVLAVEGWKLGGKFGSYTDPDSGRTSDSANGYLLATDGWIHRYNFSTVRHSLELSNAWIYDYGPWGVEEDLLNGPLEIGSIHACINEVMAGLARLAVDHGIEANELG